MDLNLLVIFFGVALAYQTQVSTASDYYVGAVVEYNPSLLFSNNIDRYEHLIGAASNQAADIIVFPEGGLFPVGSFAVPDPLHHICPCDDVTSDKNVVQRLSCAAKVNKIYVVANLKEERKIIDSNGKEKVAHFNTNVVFDRSGYVIARYAKYNLFDENATKPEKAETVFFTTDFGVTFGTFICFDLLFHEPTLRLARQYGVTDFVFSTFWFSEMPFLTAYQAQQGWAEANNVNLLASGVNKPILGSTGSGIYNGKWGPLVVSFEDRPATKLLVARIKKIKEAKESEPSPVQMPSFSNIILDFTNKAPHEISENSTKAIDLELLHDQIFLFNSKQVTIGSFFETEVCSANDFCCSFKIRADKIREDDFGYNYRAVAFDGVRLFGKLFTGGIQSCGLVLCNGPSLLNCTNRVTNISGIFEFTQIDIKGNFLSKNSIQFPTTLVGKPQLEALPPKAYLFKTEEYGNKLQTVSMELLWPVKNLQTFAIWGRNYVRDGKEVSMTSSSISTYSFHPVLITCLCLLSSLPYLLK